MSAKEQLIQTSTAQVHRAVVFLWQALTKEPFERTLYEWAQAVQSDDGYMPIVALVSMGVLSPVLDENGRVSNSEGIVLFEIDAAALAYVSRSSADFRLSIGQYSVMTVDDDDVADDADDDADDEENNND